MNLLQLVLTKLDELELVDKESGKPTGFLKKEDVINLIEGIKKKKLNENKDY